MASYTAEVAKIHKTFNSAVRSARTRGALVKAYNAHSRAHQRIMKKHLREERAQVERAKRRL